MSIQLVFIVVEAVLPSFECVPGVFELFRFRVRAAGRSKDTIFDEENP